MMIHQLQATYQAEQDRILIRLNTRTGEELRLWLTRRMVKNLFPHILQATAELDGAAQMPFVSHDGPHQQDLTKFRKQESLQQADFKTPFSTEAPVLPLGSTPLLVTTVHITPSNEGSLRIGFVEQTPEVSESRQFEVTLAPPLLHGFMHLLESALKHADWGITLPEDEKPKETKPLDAFASAEPPHYLN